MLKNCLVKKLFFRKNRVKRKRTRSLTACPQKKGDCIKVFKMSPKKPNSANRSVARVKLTNGKKVFVYIPGKGHNLQQHSTVLIRGGRAQDLPGVHFRAIRGKFDLERIEFVGQGRSKYGGRKIWKR